MSVVYQSLSSVFLILIVYCSLLKFFFFYLYSVTTSNPLHFTRLAWCEKIKEKRYFCLFLHQCVNNCVNEDAGVCVCICARACVPIMIACLCMYFMIVCVCAYALYFYVCVRVCLSRYSCFKFERNSCGLFYRNNVKFTVWLYKVNFCIYGNNVWQMSAVVYIHSIVQWIPYDLIDSQLNQRVCVWWL